MSLRILLRCSILALGALVAATASAQPMAGGAGGAPPMMDPSKMSGIPRPDGAVPKGTLTVRLVRNQLANKIVDHPVELVDGEGKLVATQKTDAEGRATFAGLGPGPYNARAKDASGQELVSQPVQMPPEVGVRMMLVFRAEELGVPDGTARLDKSLPAGTVRVEVQDDKGAPVDGVEVQLVRATANTGDVEQSDKKTDKGVALFTAQKTGATYGYLLQVLGPSGSKQQSPPFRLPDNLGMRAVFQRRLVAQDTSTLKLERGSHLLMEVGDQVLQVIWLLQIDNSGGTAVDPGPSGLRIPLPAKAASISLGEDAPPGRSVDGKSVVLKGPIAPGRTEVRIFFALPYDTDSVEVALPLPLPLAERAAIVEQIDGMTVSSQGLTSERRELGGKPLLLMRGPGAPAGDTFVLKLSGLPMPDRRARNGAMLLALVMLIVGLGVAFSGPEADQRRETLMALEAERDRLFDEAAALDDGPALKKKLERLALIYRKLDEG